MDCADVRDALTRGEQPEDPQWSVHLRGCELCSELVADDGQLGRGLGGLRVAKDPEGPELAALLKDLDRDLARERGLAAWLRALPTPARIGAALLGAGLVAGLVLAFRRRPDLEVYPLARLIPAVGAFALLVGAAIRVALRPLQLRALPAGYRIAIAAAAVIMPFVIAAAPAAHAAHASSLGGIGTELLPRALQCFAFGSALALPPLLLLWALDRGAHRSWLAALCGAGAAGLVGIVSLELHCPLTHPVHLVVGHATVGAALVVSYGLVTWLRRGATARDG